MRRQAGREWVSHEKLVCGERWRAVSVQKQQQVKDIEAQIVPSKISNLVSLKTKGKHFFFNYGNGPNQLALINAFVLMPSAKEY